MNMLLKNLSISTAALVALLVSGCGVTPDSFEKASKACEYHGGLQIYYVSPWVETHCLDGTVIASLGD